MKKATTLVLVLVLACPAFATEQTREAKRLEACGQVFKEIMDIPDGIPKDLPIGRNLRAAILLSSIGPPNRDSRT